MSHNKKNGVRDNCHLLLLSRRGIVFVRRVLIHSHIHKLMVGHSSGHLHPASHVFWLRVQRVVSVLPVRAPNQKSYYSFLLHLSEIVCCPQNTSSANLSCVFPSQPSPLPLSLSLFSSLDDILTLAAHILATSLSTRTRPTFVKR